jgi:uncharacterized protein YsxB (DUF464 family)
MVKVVITNKNKEIDKIEIKGHAMYDDYGKDIVCAGISSTVITTVNAILTFNKDYISYEIKENNFLIKVNNHNEIVNNLLNNMINMLQDIENDYPNNIKIRKENL